MNDQDVQEAIESASDLSREELDEKLAKLSKKIPDDIVEELQQMSKEDLRSRITRCQLNITESKLAQERDEELESAQVLVKKYKGPYTDAIKMQKAISEYASLRLNYE
jgi:hypothetical protein